MKFQAIIMISNNKSRAGQSLIEVLIGLAIAVMLIGAAVLAIAFMLRAGTANQKYQIASGLNREMLDKMRAVASAKWNDLYDREKGASTRYYVGVANGLLEFYSGPTSTLVEGTTYESFFSVENVSRDASGDIVENGFNDPSTQKVVVYTKWPSGDSFAEVKVVDYVTRWGNAVFHQTDWTGGAVSSEVLNQPTNTFESSTDIDFSNSGLIKIQGF